MIAARAATLLCGCLLAGCPTLPPPAPRARATLVSLERTGEASLHAHLSVELEGRRVAVTAVDWEIALPGGPPLLRGRAATVDVDIALPAALARRVTTATRLRLRGAVHLHERHTATFDAIAPLR
jgi:hypothetical protein